jgi:hypothetical protein
MGDRSQYVDVFFRNGLKEFEVLPPPEVWENIKPAIRKREKSQNILRLAAMIAILISLPAASIWFTHRISQDFYGPAISLNQDIIPEGSYTPGTYNKIAHAIQIPVLNDQITEPDHFKESVTSKPADLKSFSTQVFTSGLKESKVQRFASSGIPPKSAVRNSSSTEIGKLIVLTSNRGSENKVNRWTLSAMASPDYYSNVTNGNNKAATELAGSEKPVVSYSGGMGVSFKVNKRMSVQSGVIYSSIGQKITGISSYSGFSDYSDAKGSGQFSVQTSNGIIISNNNNIFLRDEISGRVLSTYTADSFDPSKADLTYLNSSITQNFNYLQIPVLLRYKAIDRKIDVNFVGGLSYNMLVGNSAFAKVDGEKYPIGKTEGLSSVNFSSSLGLGFEYSFSGKISLNIEPTFRYFLTPLGGLVGSSLHPYSFGVLSGFSYKF